MKSKHIAHWQKPRSQTVIDERMENLWNEKVNNDLQDFHNLMRSCTTLLHPFSKSSERFTIHIFQSNELDGI